MWWLLFIGLYFFISRAVVVFYYAVRGDSDWKMVLSGSVSGGEIEEVSVLVPIVGDIWFLFVIASLLFYHPLLWIGNSGEWISSTIAERKKRKAEVQKRQKEYLNNLAQYGLTPKDIPAYAKEPAALKEYLSAWQTVNGKARAQTHA